MQTLILCGVFAEENEAEVVSAARRPVEFSANLTQKKLISGFRAVCEDTRVLSAPFLGAYPNASARLFFRGFEKEQTLCRYVPFFNLWGVRNWSRTRALVRALRNHSFDADGRRLLVVYCPHTPFLKAAEYVKRRDPSVHVCLYVPDLPQYMNLSAHVSPIYKIAKFFDIRAMHRAMRSVDSFVLLTEAMREKLPVQDKPCLVCEGLVEQAQEAADMPPSQTRNVVYTGGLHESFGVRELICAMEHLPDEDLRLVLCGGGELLPYARACAARDPRILVLGQVSPEQAREHQRSAAVLVNPRPGTAEYTRFSFPSKNLEYLLSGRAVVAYQLCGMPKEYAEFCFTVDGASASESENLAAAIARALSADGEEIRSRHRAFVRYAQEHLLATRVAENIKELGK